MNTFQLILISLKVFIISFVLLTKFNIIKDRPLKNLAELLFDILLGIYILVLANPFKKKTVILDRHDRLFLTTMSIIFLVSIDYTSFFQK